MRVIAIDGPAGSGKSTVARAVAERLGIAHLDSGAMYRAVAFAALRRGVDPTEADPIARVAADMELALDGATVIVDGADASIEIRGPEISRAVSAVAANPSVRVELVSRQREWVARRQGAVVEGRDIGTVVFPDAELKVFLVARPEVRARRRHRELEALDYETVAADMATRDAIDSERAVSPLRPAADAVLVDTSDRDVEAVVAEVLALLDDLTVERSASDTDIADG